MVAILNKIDECAPPPDKRHHRELSDIDLILVHRCGVAETAEEVARWYEGYKEIGSMPYHFFIPKSGATSQTLPLTHIGPHAWKQSKRSIGIAVDGDFTKHYPTANQVAALRELVRLLSLFIYPTVPAEGHTHIPLATKDLNKVCPGEFMDMDALRRVVGNDIRSDAKFILTQIGVQV